MDLRGGDFAGLALLVYASFGRCRSCLWLADPWGFTVACSLQLEDLGQDAHDRLLTAGGGAGGGLCCGLMTWLPWRMWDWVGACCAGRRGARSCGLDRCAHALSPSRQRAAPGGCAGPCEARTRTVLVVTGLSTVGHAPCLVVTSLGSVGHALCLGVVLGTTGRCAGRHGSEEHCGARAALCLVVGLGTCSVARVGHALCLFVGL